MLNLKTITYIQNKKKALEKITMLTAYDYCLGQLLDRVGVDIILVGDSVANVVLGLDVTTDMTMDEMIYHAKAVRRGVKNALLIGDMPFVSYQINSHEAVDNARRFVQEAGCGGVKLEWFDQCIPIIEDIVRSDIPVMGHIGLTPQTAEKLGGMKVQGCDMKSAEILLTQARSLEQVGCFSIVLECIPMALAKVITKDLSIPTIGIGAGVHCDGQVLVTHDLLGLFNRYRPKFVKTYANLSDNIMEGVKQYCKEVQEGQFPSKEQSFL